MIPHLTPLTLAPSFLFTPSTPLLLQARLSCYPRLRVPYWWIHAAFISQLDSNCEATVWRERCEVGVEGAQA